MHNYFKKYVGGEEKKMKIQCQKNWFLFIDSEHLHSNAPKSCYDF